MKGPVTDGQEATNEEGGAHRELDGAIHPPLQRSESTAYESCLFTLPNTQTNRFFFSASSFYPGRGDSGNTFPPSAPRPPSTPVLNRNFHADGIDDDSEVEKEGDWHSDESGPEGSAPQRATRFSEALAIEVRSPLIVNDLISMLIS